MKRRSVASRAHPAGGIRAGQRLVRTPIPALVQSDAWGSAAFACSSDDWGGCSEDDGLDGARAALASVALGFATARVVAGPASGRE